VWSGGRVSAFSVKGVRSAYSPFLPMLKDATGRKYPMPLVHTPHARALATLYTKALSEESE